MRGSEMTFPDYRLLAARSFAQTMIVIDDEASQYAETQVAEPKTTRLTKPSRFQRPSSLVELNEERSDLGKHALNAKLLIENAMDLGLICSVLRPRKGELIKDRVKKAAERADIVCLDWEIHGDAGRSAVGIIKEIAESDARKNGRLRLIAIYTGDTTNNRILEKVFDAFSTRFKRKHNLKRESLLIQSNGGLKIVCLFKAHGIQLADARSTNQVTEDLLPKRLQVEFSALADGLLSSVAIATIASIRDATHHVLAKITGSMDGPYFHHRAIIANVSDAEEYAINVILSELKNAIDKQNVGEVFAGPKAIAARIREIANGSGTLPLRYDQNGPKQFDVPVEDAIKIVNLGIASAQSSLANAPNKKIIQKEISTLFSKDRQTAHSEMRQFAAVTGTRAHPGSHLFRDGERHPHLGLGTIVQSVSGEYLLCLQASCDSVRVRKPSNFLFARLEERADDPDHVIQILRKGKPDWIGLGMKRSSYAETVSILFNPTENKDVVTAGTLPRRRGLFFSDADGAIYRWIADLKHRRALRTVQKLGQEMSRLGFDEFEPFRK